MYTVDVEDLRSEITVMEAENRNNIQRKRNNCIKKNSKSFKLKFRF